MWTLTFCLILLLAGLVVALSYLLRFVSRLVVTTVESLTAALVEALRPVLSPGSVHQPTLPSEALTEEPAWVTGWDGSPPEPLPWEQDLTTYEAPSSQEQEG